jgi:thiamine biosynthesis lipoprotein
VAFLLAPPTLSKVLNLQKVKLHSIVRFIKTVGFLCLVIGAMTQCEKKRNIIQVGGPTMGSTWSLLAVGGDEKTRHLIQTHLDQREAVFSHWKPNSALSQFNVSSTTDWFPVPAELAHIVELAHRISQDTNGALDVTVAPLIEAWGFGATPKADKTPQLPDLSNIGWQHLSWRLDPPALKKDRSDVRINVASITEGFVMDELVTLLKKQGLKDFLLEVGGEVAAIGQAPGKKSWRVGIQVPDAEKGESLESITLSDLCVATSGSYRHRYEKDGRQYSHIIDPRTGAPVTHSLISVSVVHQSASLADGYATALMVLGPEAGRKRANELGLRVIWLEKP